MNTGGNNQVGLVNAANFYTSLNRGSANGGRPDVAMTATGGTLPSYNTVMHGGYMPANAGNVQMGLHDMNAYQLTANDMNAGDTIDEEDAADAEWNMQMNMNMLKQ
jgi:hypothetical protein